MPFILIVAVCGLLNKNQDCRPIVCSSHYTIHIHCHTYFKGRGPFRKPIILVWHVKQNTIMWKNLPFFALLICFFTIFSGVKGQKNVKFLVLVEENAQMDLKAKLGDGLAKAQSSNAGFTFEMTPFDVV